MRIDIGEKGLMQKNLKFEKNNNNDIIEWNGLEHYEKHIGCTKIFLLENILFKES